jgi:hypothetical protein
METRIKHYEQAIQDLQRVCEEQKELTIKAKRVSALAEVTLLFVIIATVFFLTF